MKILVAHNSYQNRGGEDAVCESEITILRDAGHEVIEYLRQNDEILGYSFFEKARLGLSASWSARTSRDLQDILARESPSVAHFHNTFPLISPSAHYACRAAGVPVVQTLHNFRLLCPGGNLFREGRVCEECVSHSLVHSVTHSCYRDSRAATAALASMLALHRLCKTWTTQVDLFLVCTEFARRTFVNAGFDESRIKVKPNFIPAAPRIGANAAKTAMFIGRLSEEKGPQLLLSAWSKLAQPIPLEIVGDGPLRASLDLARSRLNLHSVHLTGWLVPTDVMEFLRLAKFLIVPSICYEGFPLAIAEAYAHGVPVIAAGHGGLAEIVLDGFTGLHFRPGDAEDLASKVAWAWLHPREMETMGRAARLEYETKYTRTAALSHLESAYEYALKKNPATTLQARAHTRAELYSRANEK